MPSLTEILLIVVIVLAIFMLPRLMKKGPETNMQSVRGKVVLTGWKRLAILVSVLWVILAALYFRPWNGPWIVFLCAGAGPPVLGWGLFWVLSGFLKK
jgi:hypothetical protein